MNKTCSSNLSFPKTTINISRKGSVVKEKARQLCEIVNNLYENGRVSDQDLTYLIATYVGSDKETVRAYKGYSGFIRIGRNENKLVGKSRKGYLQDLGFMRKLNRDVWCVNQMLLIGFSGVTNNERLEKANHQKISLSAISVVKDGCRKIVDTTSNNNNNNTERERFFSENKHIEAYPICMELEKLAHAEPTEEPDHSSTVRYVDESKPTFTDVLRKKGIPEDEIKTVSHALARGAAEILNGES